MFVNCPLLNLAHHLVVSFVVEQVVDTLVVVVSVVELVVGEVVVEVELVCPTLPSIALE